MHKVLWRQPIIMLLIGILPFLVIPQGMLPSASAAGARSFSSRTSGDFCGRTSVRQLHPARDELQNPAFNSMVVVARDKIVCRDLTLFGGSLTVRGGVDGDILMLGGNVIVSGTINGNMTLYGGNLTLRDGAHVNGDIHVCGGIWTSGSNFRRNGSVFSCTTSLETLFTNGMSTALRFWFIVVSTILGVVLTFLLPEHLMLVRTTVQSRLGRSGMLGILSVLLSPAILAVLVGLIIPIPLAMLLLVGLLAAWVMGTVAIGSLVGETILSQLTPQQHTRFLEVIVGMVILGLVESLPRVGLWIIIGSGLVGLGAVLLSRFGTQLYGPPRHPFPL